MPTRSQYALMSSKDKNMVMFACASSAIMFFDFLIYLYLAEIISTVFFSADLDEHFTKIQGLGLFAAGYLARPLGGIIFGRFGDTVGRKPVLMTSLLVTAVTMLAMALLPTYAQWGIMAPIIFIILRMIQGMAFGVYVPLSWIFVSEHLPRQYLTVGCSYVTAGFLAGVLFSNAFFNWITSTMTPDQLITYGWRIPFMIAAALSCVPLLAWRFIQESPFFVEMQSKQPADYKPRPLSLLSKHCRHAMFITMMLTFVIASITIVVVLLLPDLIELKFALDNDLFQFSHSLGMIFMIFGCIFYGLISNYQNFGKILIAGSILLVAQMFAFYYQLQAGGDYILIMYALLGFFAGIIGMVPAIFVQLFSTNVRLTGLAISYNVMYAFVGGVMPFVLGYFTSFISFAPALYIAFVCAIGVMMGLYFYHLPEFRKVNQVL